MMNAQRMSVQSSAGFGILEMMVVLGIMAILAAISVPVYRSYTSSVQGTEIVLLYDELRTGLQADFQQEVIEDCSTIQNRAGGAGLLTDHYANVRVDFNAAPGGFKPVLVVYAEASQNGALGIGVAEAVYDQLTQLNRVNAGAVISNSIVSFTAPISDRAGPDCLIAVAGNNTAAGNVASSSGGSTSPIPSPVASASPNLAPALTPGQAPLPQPAAAPTMIDLDWYSNLDTLNDAQLIDWYTKYGKPANQDAASWNQMMSMIATDRVRESAKAFQRIHTPATPPQNIPTPTAQKIPQLSAQQSRDINGMQRNELLDYAIQNMYQGNENLRSLIDRYNDDELKQLIQDAQN